MTGHVLPQTRRAGSPADEIAEARLEGLLEGLDMLACGGILVGGSGLMLKANRKAEALLRCGGLRLAHGQVSACDAQADAALHELVAAVLHPQPVQGTEPRGPILVPSPARCPLIVHAAPLAQARDAPRPASAILMIVDPNEHLETATSLLRQAFGLSRAEACLAVEIGLGRDIREIALARRVSEGTIRAQLRSVFGKTDTHRQAQLTALVARLATPPLRTPFER